MNLQVLADSIGVGLAYMVLGFVVGILITLGNDEKWPSYVIALVLGVFVGFHYYVHHI